MATTGAPEPPEAHGTPYTGVYSESVIVLDAPARMMTMNWARGVANRWEVAEVTQLWRFCAKVRARTLAVPAYGHLRVRVTPYQAKGRLADAGAHLPCAKAAIDGLIDARVLEDDSPAYVGAITLVAPQRGPDGLRIELRGTLAE